MGKEHSTFLLEKELDLTHGSIIDTWKVYMTWYTYYFSANLVVMSWIFTNPTEISKSDSIWFLSALWIVLNLLGTIVAIWLSRYSYAATKRMEKVLARINTEGVLTEQKPPFPIELSVIGAISNAVALVANIVAWSYIGIKFG